LDAVACFFDIDSSKIQSYGDWFNALETVLKNDKLAAMPGIYCLLILFLWPQKAAAGFATLVLNRISFCDL